MSALAELEAGLVPEQMIPGQVGALRGRAMHAQQWADVLFDVAKSLAYIETSWTGEAAEAFNSYFDLQPARFSAAGHSFQDYGRALTDHALVLEDARGQAAAALAEFTAAREAAAAMPPTAPGVLTNPSLATLLGPSPEQAAVQKLQAAKDSVEASGFSAASKIEQAAEAAPTKSRMAQAMKIAFGQTEAPTFIDLSKGSTTDVMDGLFGVLRGGLEMPMQSMTRMTPGQLDWLMNHLEKMGGIDSDSKAHLAGYIGVGLIGPGFGVKGAARGFAKLAERLAAIKLAELGPGAIKTLLRGGSHEIGHVSLWKNPEMRKAWVDDWLSSPGNTRAENHPGPAYDYQRLHAGPDNIRLTTGDGKTQIWADGLHQDPDKVVAVDSKHVGSSNTSLNEGKGPDFIQESHDAGWVDEVERYAEVIRDPGNPVDRLRIVTNTEAAAEHLATLAHKTAPDIDIVTIVRK